MQEFNRRFRIFTENMHKVVAGNARNGVSYTLGLNGGCWRTQRTLGCQPAAEQQQRPQEQHLWLQHFFWHTHSALTSAAHPPCLVTGFADLTTEEFRERYFGPSPKDLLTLRRWAVDLTPPRLPACAWIPGKGRLSSTPAITQPHLNMQRNSARLKKKHPPPGAPVPVVQLREQA